MGGQVDYNIEWVTGAKLVKVNDELKWAYVIVVGDDRWVTYRYIMIPEINYIEAWRTASTDAFNTPIWEKFSVTNRAPLIILAEVAIAKEKEDVLRRLSESARSIEQEVRGCEQCHCSSGTGDQACQG